MTEYVTRALLKAANKIAPDDTTKDELLDLAVGAANEGIDSGCRNFGLSEPQTRSYAASGRISYDRRDCVTFATPDIGLLGTVSVGYSGSYTELDAADFEPVYWNENADPATQAIVGLRGIGVALGGARIRFAATRFGWPVEPYAVKQAALLQANRLFARINSPEGVLGSSEWGAVRVGRLDPDVRQLLASYMIPAIG
jgi:hypothetical protein